MNEVNEESIDRPGDHTSNCYVVDPDSISHAVPCEEGSTSQWISFDTWAVDLGVLLQPREWACLHH